MSQTTDTVGVVFQGEHVAVKESIRRRDQALEKLKQPPPMEPLPRPAPAKE